MSSFRNYGDMGAYRTRIGMSSSSGTFGRTGSTGSTFSNYRSNYTGIGSSSVRTTTIKGRSIGNFYTTNYTKKDGEKTEEKPSFKYSFNNSEKEKLTPGKLSKDETRSCSRSSNGSVLEKYTMGNGKLSSERPPSVLERYRGSTSRETSREPDSISSRYGGSNSQSCRNYGNDKKDKEHELTSHRRLKMPTRRSREPSPEISSKIPTHKMHSKTINFGKNSNASNATESNASSSPSKDSSMKSSECDPTVPTNSPERVTTKIIYTDSEKCFNPSTKSESFSVCDNIPSPSQNCNTETCSDTAQLKTKSDKPDALKKEQDQTNNISNDHVECSSNDNVDEELIIISVVTRGTSPTPPPPLTAFTRTRKLERIPKAVLKEMKKSELHKIETREQEQQVEYGNAEDLFKDRYNSRYNNSNIRKTFGAPWVSSYLDKFNSSPSSANSSSYTLQNNHSTSNNKTTVSCTYSKSNDSTSTSTTKKSSIVPPTKISHIDRHNCTNSNSSSLSSSKDTNAQGNDRSLSKLESNQKKRTTSSCNNEDRKSNKNQEESARIVEGQDHGQGSVASTSRKESLSKSSDSSSSSQSKPGNVSRSGSLKLRHLTSSQSSSAVNVPVGCTGGNNSSSSSSSSSTSSSSRSSSSKSASSVSSVTAASMTKIKSVATTTTALPLPNGKCATISAGSSVTSRQASSPDAHDRKPPVPKSEMVGKNGTMGGPGGLKYVNKDFRKSALNMENGDPSRSQITDRKHQKKYQRSMSLSSQDSQSELNSSSMSMQQVASSGSSLRSNKSGSKLKMVPVKPNVARKGDKKSPAKDTRRSNSKSPTSHNNGHISKTLSVSTSECSLDGTSSESYNSEEEDNHSKETKTDIKKKRTSNSPFQEHKGKRSVDSSRTSVLASSTDELSINTDKPPRPPSVLRSRSDRSGKTDEAKSFLIRTLAPVTNIYKMKQQENSDEIKNGSWVEACSEETSEFEKKSQNPISPKSVTPNLSRSPSLTNMESNSTIDKRRTNTRVRRQSSGEKAWWLDSNSDNVPEGVERHSSVGNDDISQDTTISTVLPDDGKFKFKIWRQESGERAWWLDASDDNNGAEDESMSSRKCSSPGSSRIQRTSPVGRLRHQQSGERAWWMSDDPESIPDGVEVIPVSPVSSPVRTFVRRVNRVDSGEKPWWLDSSSNVPEGVQRIPHETSNSNSDSSESFEKIEIGVKSRPQDNRIGLAKFPLDDEPLGDRASPEGIENPPDPPDNYGGRSSPYDNVTTTRQTPPRRSAPRKRPANLPLFIGNHTNIDDLLGDTTEPRRAHKKGFSKDKDMLSDSSDEECEEIDATQVIIHDSTPQTPVIQRRHRDSDRPQPDGYIPEFQEQAAIKSGNFGNEIECCIGFGPNTLKAESSELSLDANLDSEPFMM